jgi:hypothetical protein
VSLLLVLKILLVPSLVVGVTLGARRWGPAAGGWLAGLPIVAGPVLVFYAIEQGPAFAARAAQATMTAMAVNAVFSVVYAWVSRWLPWYVCLPLGWMTFAAGALAMNAWQPGLWVSLLLPVVASLIGLMLMPPAERVSTRAIAPRGDLIVRMVAATALVLTTTALAERLGPSWSGLLAAFPIVISTVSGFTHAQRGAAAVSAFFHGFVPAIIGFVVFCCALSLLLGRLSVALATIAALAVQLSIHGTVVRWLTRPTTLPAGGEPSAAWRQ